MVCSFTNKILLSMGWNVAKAVLRVKKKPLTHACVFTFVLTRMFHKNSRQITLDQAILALAARLSRIPEYTSSEFLETSHEMREHRQPERFAAILVWFMQR